MQTLGKCTVVRGAALCAALASATGTLARTLPGCARAGGVEAHDPARLDALLVLGAVAALVAVTGWATLLALTATLQALGSARAARTLRRCCPRPWRRTLLVACGLAMTASVPAHAAGGDTSSAPPGAGPATGRTPLAGLPALDRPAGAVRFAAARPGPTAGARQRTVRVRPGDSLWRLACRRRPDADPATTARRVAVLYRANRAVIGPDPDLIRPGQLLRVPDAFSDVSPDVDHPADDQHHPRRARP